MMVDRVIVCVVVKKVEWKSAEHSVGDWSV